jgi:hypothetical protein
MRKRRNHRRVAGRTGRSALAILVVLSIGAACGAGEAEGDAEGAMSRSAAQEVWRSRVESMQPPLSDWGCDPSFDRCWMFLDREGWLGMDSVARHQLVADIGAAAAVLHDALDTDFVDPQREDDLATYSARTGRVRLLQH